MNSLKYFIDHANDALLVNQISPSGRLGPFIEVSEVLCMRLDFARAELLELDPYAIFLPEDRSHVDAALDTAVETGSCIFEVVMLGRMRRSLPVELSMRLSDHDGSRIAVSVARDITDRRIIQQRKEVYSRQLRSLATRLQHIREEERAMIAREIHDDLGQNLTVLKIRLALFCDRTPELKTQFVQVLNLIDQIVDRVQKISAKLRPGMLDELGLIPAIEWQAQDFKQNTGIACDCRLPDEDFSLDNEKATAVFRILQEALTNVARHARASRVSINFYCEDDAVTLEVTDNGIGITPAQIDHFMSLGLLGMKERAMIFGGDLDIRGVPGQGTNLKLIIPLNDKKEVIHADE